MKAVGRWGWDGMEVGGLVGWYGLPGGAVRERGYIVRQLRGVELCGVCGVP